jgi:hypothetical protein
MSWQHLVRGFRPASWWRRDYEARQRAAWEPSYLGADGVMVYGCAGLWVIQRHGGASTHRWRAAGCYAYEDALWWFQRAADLMRQGSVRLVAPDGTIAALYTAPRLRSRW